MNLLQGLLQEELENSQNRLHAYRKELAGLSPNARNFFRLRAITILVKSRICGTGILPVNKCMGKMPMLPPYGRFWGESARFDNPIK
jgi:hypothetical protein